MLFGKRLQELREGVGLSQSGLASQSGIPVGTLRDYEQNRRVPAFNRVLALCRVLGVSCERFADCEFKHEERRG